MNERANVFDLARSALWRTPTLDDLERFLSHEPAFALLSGTDCSGSSALEKV
jgi:hypothetical protein